MDMSKFPDGPWNNEPTGPVEFEHAGVDCRLQRGPFGAWCGYVAIPRDHPLYGTDATLDECVALDVHGGVTYTGSGIIGNEDKFVIGFDCAHCGDLVPGAIPYDPHHEIYRDVDYATAETKKLAEQIAVIGAKSKAGQEQQPTIGRIVHYQSYGTPSGEYQSVPRAAIITEVGENGLVGLCVLNPSGMFFNQNVPFGGPDQPGSWSWPPRN